MNACIYNISTGKVRVFSDHAKPLAGEAKHELTAADRTTLLAGGPFKIVNGALAVDENAPAKSRQVSKLSVRRKLRALNKEAALDAFLDANPTARADWDDAQFLNTTDPIFTTYAGAVKTALSLSDEQFASLLR